MGEACSKDRGEEKNADNILVEKPGGKKKNEKRILRRDLT